MPELAAILLEQFFNRRHKAQVSWQEPEGGAHDQVVAGLNALREHHGTKRLQDRPVPVIKPKGARAPR
jgi:hypothetical protein